MSSHIHELWEELELPPLYPELNPEDISARVSAALDRDTELPPTQAEPGKTPMKRRITSIVLFAAVLALMAGTVLGAAYRSGVLELFFPNGDTSQVEPYVRTALDTVETKDWRATVDSALYDGQSLFALITLQGRGDQAAQSLITGQVIAQGYLEQYRSQLQGEGLSLTPEEEERVVSEILENGTPENWDLSCDVEPYAGFSSAWEVKPAGGDSRTWAFRLEAGYYVGAQSEPLEVWFTFLGQELTLKIPLDQPVEPIRLSSGQEVEADGRLGLEGTLTDLALTPLSCTFTLERRGDWVRGEYLTSMEPMDTKELKLFWLKKTDGTLLPPWELGSADALSALADGTHVSSSALEGTADLSGTTLTVSASFDAPLDLSEFSAFLYGGWEFPLDGSAPQPAQGEPEGTFYPFTAFSLSGKPECISDLEAFCRGIRADYSYDRPSRTATAVYRGVTLTVTADSSTALVDGAPFEMPLSAQRSGLSLAVPADLLAQAWDLELVQDIREDGSVGSYTVYPGLT